MTANTITGEELLGQLSDLIGDSWTSETTAAGATGGTSITDTALQRYKTDALAGRYVRIVEGAAINEVRRIQSNTTAGVVTVAPAFSVQIDSAISYEIHAYDPRRKFAALDRARLYAFPAISKIIFDESLTGDGINSVFDLPDDLRAGPYFVFEEIPLEARSQQWNFLTSPRGDALSGWTLAGSGASRELVQETDADRLVPKYDTFCTKISVPNTTATTYTQVVGDMTNGITAAKAAGRRMTYAAWVYSLVADRVTLRIADDAGNADSAAHGGRGWELLTVSKDIDGDNASTLSVSLQVSSGDPMTLFWNRAWFLFGDRIPEIYLREVPLFQVRRDGTVQRLYLGAIPHEGYQLRVIGRGLVSALGTDLSSQATNTMELDDQAAELLVAKAAQLLFQEVGVSSDSQPTVFQKIATSLERLEELDTGDFVYRLPSETRIRTPWV